MNTTANKTRKLVLSRWTGYLLALIALSSVLAIATPSGSAKSDQLHDLDVNATGTDGTTEFEFDLYVKSKKNGKHTVKFSFAELNAKGKKIDQFKLKSFSALEFVDDLESLGPCGLSVGCDANWNTVSFDGVGSIGKDKNISASVEVLDGGADASSDLLRVLIKDSEETVIHDLELSIVPSTSGKPKKNRDNITARGFIEFVPSDLPIITDTFTDVVGSSLEDHTPELVQDGGWDDVVFDTWRVQTIKGGTGAANFSGTDNRYIATTDAGYFNSTIEVDVTYVEGATGLVFRYLDSENHFRLEYDGNKSLSLVKVQAGVETELAKKKFTSKGADGKIRVELDGDSIAARYGKTKLNVSDSFQQLVTRSGMIYSRPTQAVWDSFNVHSLGEFPVTSPPLDPAPSIAESVIYDTFTEAGSVSLASHIPDKDAGSGWSTGAGGIGEGTWVVETDSARQTILPDIGDLHAVIDAGVADVDIRVDVHWRDAGAGDPPFRTAGLVFRYESESDWYKVFYVESGELILAKFTNPGGFKEVGRVAVEWDDDSVHRLRVRKNGNSIRVYGDTDQLLIFRSDSSLAGSTNVGLFTRGADDIKFDNFIVAPSASLPVPDPDPPPPGPTPTPPPGPGPAPSEAVLYDSFNDFNGFGLAGHSADIHPFDGGWNASGWQLAGLGTTVLKGSERDFRAVIETKARDQYVSAPITYVDGRAGLVFRYNNESNWMMTWTNGSILFLAKNVGGHFQVIDSAKFKWKSGATKQLSVSVAGRRGSVMVNGETMFRFTEEELKYNTFAGVFYRAEVGTRFDDFTVFAGEQIAPALTELDPTEGLVNDFGATLELVGDNFNQHSTALVDGTPRATTFISPELLSVELTGGDTGGVGVLSILVDNRLAGGVSNALSFTIENPVPTISVASLSVGRSDTATTIFVPGTGFTTTSVVSLDGVSRPTSLMSSALLEVSLTGSDVSAHTSYSLKVTNPTPGGGESAAVPLVVQNPTPVITALATIPEIIGAGDTGVAMSIIGSGFVPESVITVNGVTRPGTLVSTSELSVILDDSDVALPGMSPVIVTNPAPGGGASSPVNLKIATIIDTFNRADGPLGAVVTGTNYPGDDWDKVPSFSNWQTVSGAMQETSGIPWRDLRVYIDAGAADVEASAEITLGGTGERLGVVVRGDSSDHFQMFWFAGGKLWSYGHSSLKSQSFSWPVGVTHTLTIRANGNGYEFLVDGDLKWTKSSGSYSGNTEVGLFARAVVSGTFDNFVVVPLDAP